MLDGWVPLADFARERNTQPQTMRRRLVALAKRLGTSRFLRRPGKRHFWVHPERLKRELERDPFEQLEVQRLSVELENLRRNVEALKTWRKLLIRRGIIPRTLLATKNAERLVASQSVTDPPTIDRGPIVDASRGSRG